MAGMKLSFTAEKINLGDPESLNKANWIEVSGIKKSKTKSGKKDGNHGK